MITNCPGCGREFRSRGGLHSHRRSKFAEQACKLPPRYRVVWDKAVAEDLWRPTRTSRLFEDVEKAAEFARSLDPWENGSTVPQVALDDEELSGDVYLQGFYSPSHQRFAVIFTVAD